MLMRRIRRVFCLLSVGLIVFSVTACNSAEVNGARLTGSTFSLFGRQNNSFDTYSNGFLSGDGENRQIDTGYMHIR